jgi:hypothetical protein
VSLSIAERNGFIELLDLLCTGDIGPQQLERLEQTALDSSEALGLYLEAMRIHRGLEWLFRDAQKAEQPSAGAASTARVTKPMLGFLGPVATAINRPTHWAVLAAGVAFVAYLGVITWGMLDREPHGSRLAARGEQEAGPGRLEADGEAGDSTNPNSQASRNKPPATPVATIVDTLAAEWSASAHRSAIKNHKSAIASGESLHLASGQVEVKLKQGVTLRVEGPAEWTIDEDNVATLKHGRLVAHVPRGAVGFTLVTPQAKIVDLGTEFGVEVASNGTAKVHVLQGKIEVQSDLDSAGLSHPLQAGQSAQITSQGTRFIVNAELVEKLSHLANASQHRPASNPGYEVVFHYRLGENDSHAKAGEVAAEQAIGTGTLGSTHPLTRVGRPEYTSQTSMADSRLALSLPGNDEAAGYLGRDFENVPTDNCVLEAWVRSRTAKTQLIVYLGDPSRNGYGLIVANGKYARLFGGVAVLPEHNEILANIWTHLALIREAGVSQLFVNGVVSGDEVRTEPRPPEQVLHIGCTPESRQTVDGHLDEIRLIRLKSYFHPKMLMCQIAEGN